MTEKVIREHHHIINSTQTRAAVIAANIVSPEWHLITADVQTEARATHGRAWISPPNVNLYATYVFPFPTHQAERLLNIPQVVTYSILETLKFYDLHPKLKWINDVLINQKKVAGVLCESFISNHLSDHYMVLAGIGININMEKEACDIVDQPATSLKMELGYLIDKAALLTKLTSHLTTNVELLLNHHFDFFLPKITEQLAFLGENIKLQLDDTNKTVKEGIFEGINNQGMLLLNCDGKLETYLTGRILR